MTDLSLNPSLDSQLKDFFLGRQPILNRNQGLVAYELLFRRAGANAAGVIDDLSATAAVIEHASSLGMDNVIGGSLGFVNIDASVLMSDFVQFLPRNKVVLEILETVKVTESLLARVKELRQGGYSFALDDVVADTDDIRRLLPLVDIIKIDILDTPISELARLIRRCKSMGKKLLAEKVETAEQVQLCLQLGFDYFQGYYFAKPVILTGKKLTPSQLSLIKLMGLINSDAENADIERVVKQDASISLNLLRMANSPALGTGHRIASLNQALMLLGRRQLQRWLQILLYAEPARRAGELSPLLVLATTRGKLLELIANRLEPDDRHTADVAFTVGIMSLMDALFDLPMEKILQQVAVTEVVAGALMARSGTHGEMLRLVEYMERFKESGALLPPALDRLKLPIEDLLKLQLAAYEWSDQVSHQA
jgi:EAL and modified HD-GYP domain-containing signal transduction protein